MTGNSEAYNTFYRDLDVAEGYEPKRVDRYDQHIVDWTFWKWGVE